MTLNVIRGLTFKNLMMKTLPIIVKTVTRRKHNVCLVNILQDYKSSSPKPMYKLEGDFLHTCTPVDSDNFCV